MVEETKSLRYRINIKETAKHEKYWDCTVDGTGYNKEKILAESDLMVAELEKRYPFSVEEKK